MQRTAPQLNKAAMIVMSDADRAIRFAAALKLREPPRIVMNCPRRMETLPRPQHSERLGDYVPTHHRRVVFLGSVGRDQGVVETVRSMCEWPTDAHFVVIGPVAAAMREQLTAEAAKNGTHQRLHLLGARPHKVALALAAQADVAVALIQPTAPNWEFSAGAINKRFEYAALGLPQVTSDLPGVRSIFEKPPCALFVSPQDTTAAGRAITKLLQNPPLRAAMAQAARQQHLSELNYEKQFTPLADEIEKQCQRNNTI